MLEPRSKGVKPTDNKISMGKGTLRLRSKGPATVEEEVRILSNLSKSCFFQWRPFYNNLCCILANGI